MSDNKDVSLESLGEFGLIDHLTSQIEIKNESTLKGIGDDAAVLDYKGKQTVVTTDLLLQGIHFDLVYTPLKHLGYKAVMVNLSDVYAMNAIPKQITVSLGLSSKVTLPFVEQLYEGIQLACDKHHVDLIGGDTTTSLTGLTISVTAIGEAGSEDIVYRSGAKPNDLICVTGDLGGAYMGLQVLEREKRVHEGNLKVQPDLSGYDYILERQLKPEARRDLIEFLKEIGVKPTAMIDISDGLSSEILHICKQSNTGCRIYENKIPIDHVTSLMAEEINMNPTIAALNGGEDYELLFTISMADYEKFSKETDLKIYTIGHITEESKGKILVSNSDQEIALQAQGWNMGSHH
ncbi:thiamine-phosphate kinase [Saccharicrinis fermentans]|uniref:Thiamine-monophosphate kinase n=1 Tax=Saccharicrinis fermentans DSM 9555 = JCM 21142 TaxID=869213 RepID=W7Y2B7_9BACT|nr:thiamine-phosphate kinase [Saccharicrinis fermentans]GAF04995.1 thiamine-monophosphate kinase [Saccharicrinis fermentans DSM 9555 = JCM 21142]